MPEWTRDRVRLMRLDAAELEFVCDQWLAALENHERTEHLGPEYAVLNGEQDEALDAAVTALLDALGRTTIEIDYPGLQVDLDELESTDSAVKAAAESYDRMVTELTWPIPGDGAA